MSDTVKAHAAIGIDLGTTNSVLACLEGGVPRAVPVYGEPTVPSVVLFLDDRVVVGREARNLALQHPERVVRSAKRRMGTEHRYQIAGRALSPEEVSAEVLRALKTEGERELGHPIREVVITVPAYFDDLQRRATLRAGELAGLEVLRLLNEPTAASLVYDQVGTTGDAGGPELVLVYDLGGGTFDVSLLEVFEGVREVRATAGNTRLGGDDFDERLVRHFLDELRLREAFDPREDPRVLVRLERAAERAKIELSSGLETRVREEFLATHEGRAIHLDVTLRRAQFETMIEPLLASTIELTKRVLADAGVTAGELARVCLVGGSTRIPRVRDLLREALDADIHEEIDPDLAVGFGAAVQAGLLRGEALERILVDVTAHSLGTNVLGEHDEYSADTFVPIVPRNTVLPAVRAREFHTVFDEQPGVEVELWQGESVVTSQNTRIGSFMFDLDPAPAHSPVRMELTYDLNGVVQVAVSQPGTSRAKTVAMSVSEASARTAAAASRAGESGAGRPPEKKEASGESAVERKAVKLLASLEGDDRAHLEALLATLREAQGSARQDAEDALLDFFLDRED